MKNILMIIVSILCVSTSAFAASFNIDEKKDIDLNGIKRIVFELKQPPCALCLNTGSQSYHLGGGAANGLLGLSLDGDIKSNNKKAIPALLTEKNGDTLTIRLYKDSGLFFGLARSGTIRFNAVLPEYFDGDIEVLADSGDTTVTGINTKKILIKSSSGDIETDRIEAERIEIAASSGRMRAENLSAVEYLNIRSSSGDMKLDELLSKEAYVHASSGRIEIGRIRTVENLIIHASSGRISAVAIESGDATIEASSGKINIGSLKSRRLVIDSSSGSIDVSKLSSEDADIHASSGRISLNIEKLGGDMNIKSSSGTVNLSLAPDTAFSVDLNASSGRIKSDFRVLGEVTGSNRNEVIGDVNGGGHTIKVKASSGDITIEEK